MRLTRRAIHRNHGETELVADEDPKQIDCLADDDGWFVGIEVTADRTPKTGHKMLVRLRPEEVILCLLALPHLMIPRGVCEAVENGNLLDILRVISKLTEGAIAAAKGK
ncbi:MAG: hypothetical protein HYS12_27830 [Planctomycetes bacterium]|nr:hypothetical protein [Planctomycetota bacterium]